MFFLTFWRLATCSVGTLTKYSRRSLIGNAHTLLDRHIYSRASLMQLVSKLIMSSESYSSCLILFVKYTELKGVYRFKCNSEMPVLLTRGFKLSVYHPGVFTKLNKMVFTSQTHLLLLYLMCYSGNMFRLAIESSSGPYIKIQILHLL